jgi:hypothetical protein
LGVMMAPALANLESSGAFAIEARARHLLPG